MIEYRVDEGKAYRFVLNAIELGALQLTEKRVYTRVTDEDIFVDDVERILKLGKHEEITTMDEEIESLDNPES